MRMSKLIIIAIATLGACNSSEAAQTQSSAHLSLVSCGSEGGEIYFSQEEAGQSVWSLTLDNSTKVSSFVVNFSGDVATTVNVQHRYQDGSRLTYVVSSSGLPGINPSGMIEMDFGELIRSDAELLNQLYLESLRAIEAGHDSLTC